MEKNKAWNTIISGAALIGGAYILSEIIKGISKPIYECPSCKNIINQNILNCPHCGVRLKW